MSELERKLTGLIEDAIDHSIHAFTEGLQAKLIDLTVTDVKGEVFSSDGEWDFTITLSDGSVLRGLTSRCSGPVSELVQMAGGNPYGSSMTEREAREWGRDGDSVEW